MGFPLGKFLLLVIPTTLIYFHQVQCQTATVLVPDADEQTPRDFGPEIKRTFQVFDTPEVLSTTDISRGSKSYVRIAVEFFASATNAPIETIRVSSSCQSKHIGVTHVYVYQFLNSLRVENGVGNINVDSKGAILSFGSSFYTGTYKGNDETPSITPVEAVYAVIKYLGGQETGTLVQDPQESGRRHYIITGSTFATRPIPANLKWIQDENSDLQLTWEIEITRPRHVYNAHVSCKTGKVSQLFDLVSDATYNVYPFGVNDPGLGKRALVKDPQTANASPKGWHDTGSAKSTKTVGNNVMAQENFKGGEGDHSNNYRPDGKENLVFDFPIDFKADPKKYIDASITNLFFMNNILHDFFYEYGFDESAGNFQENNFGKGGKGHDSVIANAQDGGAKNNAFFLTPTDGTRPVMSMGLFTFTDPKRDSDLQSGIIIHEYCHGVSTRLTGGADADHCLREGEAGGMGEGWGDIIATMIRVKPGMTRKQNFVIGQYVLGHTSKGIRNYPYSTDLKTNPSKYSFILRDDYKEPHAIGEVWAEILYEVFWNLVDKHGFNPDWFVSKGDGGNNVMMQLVIDGLKFQPCHPTFVQARDAILQSDAMNYKKDNECEIWTGFAKRGLGVNARPGGTDDFTVPSQCKK